MNLFDRLVDEALRHSPTLTVLRPVVEKEILHHDILRELGRIGALADLVFMGGTCLRACYGAIRLSEDLDFYGGATFSPDQLSDLPDHLHSVLHEKYGLQVIVRGPRQDGTNVKTWKISMQTQPKRPDLPRQVVHLDICLLSALDPKPMMLRNPYGVDLGTSGLILRAASREEIYADKIVALALRRSRIKYRDVWDIHWLRQQNTPLQTDWIIKKAADRGCSSERFKQALCRRLDTLVTSHTQQREAVQELSRFLMRDRIAGVLDQPDFFSFFRDELSRDLAPLFRDA